MSSNAKPNGKSNATPSSDPKKPMQPALARLIELNREKRAAKKAEAAAPAAAEEKENAASVAGTANTGSLNGRSEASNGESANSESTAASSRRSSTANTNATAGSINSGRGNVGFYVLTIDQLSSFLRKPQSGGQTTLSGAGTGLTSDPKPSAPVPTFKLSGAIPVPEDADADADADANAKTEDGDDENITMEFDTDDLFNNPIILVKRPMATLTIADLGEFELDVDDIIAVNGAAVLEMLHETKSKKPEITSHVFSVPESATAYTFDDILPAQTEFLQLFHQLMFLAAVAKEPVVSFKDGSFEEKYTALVALLGNTQKVTARAVFGIDYDPHIKNYYAEFSELDSEFWAFLDVLKEGAKQVIELLEAKKAAPRVKPSAASVMVARHGLGHNSATQFGATSMLEDRARLIPTITADQIRALRTEMDALVSAVKASGKTLEVAAAQQYESNPIHDKFLNEVLKIDDAASQAALTRFFDALRALPPAVATAPASAASNALAPNAASTATSNINELPWKEELNRFARITPENNAGNRSAAPTATSNINELPLEEELNRFARITPENNAAAAAPRNVRARNAETVSRRRKGRKTRKLNRYGRNTF